MNMGNGTIHAGRGSLSFFEILAIRRMIRNAMNRSISHYPALDLWNFRGYIVVKEGMNE